MNLNRYPMAIGLALLLLAGSVQAVPERYTDLDALAYSDPAAALTQLEQRLPTTPDAQAWTAYLFARAFYYQNRFAESLSRLIAVEPLLENQDPNELFVLVRRLTAQNYYWMGSLNQALLVAYEAEQAASELRLDAQLAHVRNLIAAVHMKNGEQAMALDYFDRALTYFEAAGAKQDVAKLKNNMAVLHIERGELTLAEPYLIDALALGRELDRPTTIVAGLVNLIEVRTQQAQYVAAEKALADCLALAARPGQTGSVVWCREAAVEMYAAAGNLELAIEAARDVLTRSTQQGLAQTSVDMARKLSDLMADASDYEQALHYAHAAFQEVIKVNEDLLALRVEQVNDLLAAERTRAEVTTLRVQNQYQSQRQWLFGIGVAVLLPLLAGTLFLLRSKNRLVVALGHEQARTQGALEATREAKAAMEQLARTDELTGLNNRRAGLARIQSQHTLWETQSLPYAILVIDIDRFKQINDSQGHAAGDAVIKDLAMLLAAQFGADQPTARWGGEEFLVLMPGTGLAAALVAAEALRGAAHERRCDFRGQTMTYTVSIGVAGVAAGQSADGVIRRADKAMYASKNAGRNAVSHSA